MRRFFTTKEALAEGWTESSLRWAVRAGTIQHAARGLYAEGPEPLTPLESAIAEVIAAGGTADVTLAGVIYKLDAVELLGADCTVAPGRGGHRDRSKRRQLGEDIEVIHGVAVVSGLQTVIDLAAVLDDLRWEQALESALRKKLTTVEAIEAALPRLSKRRVKGVTRIRRVLALRPAGAPPTESLLETLMVQLIRELGLPEPTRQLRIVGAGGRVIARVDLCWPDLGVFLELDGQHHEGQPVHDASRQTAVAGATGWLCGRFTWRQVVLHRRATGRELVALLAQARRRPLQVR